MSHPSAYPSLVELLREAETRICSLHRIVDTLRIRAEALSGTGDAVDLVQLEERAGVIAAMHHVYGGLQKLVSVVAKTGSAAEMAHKAEISAVREGLARAAEGTALRSDSLALRSSGREPRRDGPVGDSAGGPAKAPWAPPEHLSAAREARPFQPKQPPSAIPRTPVTPNRRAVRVTDSLALDAVILPATIKVPSEILASVAPGDLYYIPRWNHFAVRIGQCVLHANVGHIYGSSLFRGAAKRDPNAVRPERVKECRRASCDGSACTFYHNPARFPDSSNVRNYTASSWAYSPPAAPARHGARRVGSIEHLDLEVRAANLEDAQCFLDQAAHDLLCALILWKYVLAPAEVAK